MGNEKPNNRVTIKDVARACNVSTQTISRVINDRADVSEATREKVLAVIEQMGYQPSALARGMRQMSTTLGVIITGLKYKGISTTLKGIAQAAEARGFSLILKELSSFGPSDIRPLLSSLMAHQVRGIIYAAPQVGDNWASAAKHFPRNAPPTVFLKGDPSAAGSTVSIDNYPGAYLVTQHMIQRGCRNIAHISGPMDWWESRERRRGWMQALRDANLDAPAQAFAEADWSPESGLAAYANLRATYPAMDGVFAANDQMALGVLYGAWRDGLRVPDQLAVAGYDDLSEAAFFTPPLTTVRQDFQALGDLAVRKLMLMAGLARGDQAAEPDAILLPPRLVVRESA